MRNILTLFQRDFKAYFSSPIAYVLIAFFLVITGIIFYLLTKSFLEYSVQLQWQAARLRQTPPPVNVNIMILRPLFQNMIIFTLIAIPAITMRTFSEDKKSGTIELLLTSPLTTTQIVVGKFLAAFALYALMILLTWVYPLIMIVFGKPDIPPIINAYAGLLGLGLAGVGMGVWVSSMTENQIIAYLGTFGGLMTLWFVGWFSLFTTSFLGDFFKYISLFEHFQDFAKGIFDTGHLVYYVSFCGISLFMAYEGIESLKWRSS